MQYKSKAEQFKKYILEFSISNPKLYDEYAKRDQILTPDRQMELSKMGKIDFLDYLMNRSTCDYLDIYPENAGRYANCFSDEIFERLRNYNEIKPEDLPKLREQLKAKAKMTALTDWQGLYTQMPRKTGEVMMTGGLEYKVKEAIPIDGPHFFITETLGYYGFFKFYEECVGIIAPKNANAYLIGNAWNVSVKNGEAASPIILGEYKDVGLKDEIYQVAPIKFFNITINKSIKYSIKTRVTKRDAEGNAIKIVRKIVPNKKNQ